MPVLMFGPWVLNEIWIIDPSLAFVGMLISSSKLLGVRLLMELYCVKVIKHVAFFTIRVL